MTAGPRRVTAGVVALLLGAGLWLLLRAGRGEPAGVDGAGGRGQPPPTGSYGRPTGPAAE